VIEMADTTEREKNKLSLSPRGKLELKKTVETGKVRQSFSHGRSKSVTVEVKRRRTYAPDGKVREDGDHESDRERAAGQLSEQERAARARALLSRPRSAEHPSNEAPAESVSEGAPEVEPEASPEPEVELTPEERELLALREAEAEERRKLEEDAERKAAEEARLNAEEEARRLEAERRAEKAKAEAAPQAEVPAKAPRPVGEAADEAEEQAARARRPGKADVRRPAVAPKRGEPRRRTGKLTIAQALGDETEEERTRSLASVRRARERERQRRRSNDSPAMVIREVVVPETITVAELANRMAIRAVDVVKVLMRSGVMASPNQIIDADTAELVVAEFGHRIKRVAESDVETGLGSSVDRDEDMLSRAPIVTIMGHVDHGKTSLLDALRETDVAAHEAGGITQHIGAYQVSLASGAKITFLDTPGHEAFSAMRSRGAKATDIVVLVVAADDSVQPQTVEAINHAKAAGVPIIVAVNKIDMPGAQPEKVKHDLLQQEIVSEDLGGDVQFVPVSALKRTNLDQLEEAILLQAELLDLKANPDRPAEGVVVEAELDRGRGTVATILVQRGTLRVGDILVAGAEWGRVRALVDERGNQVEEAGPSVPVEVLGLTGTPQAGDSVFVVENEGRARDISEFRQRQERQKRVAVAQRGSIDDIFKNLQAGTSSKLPIVVKADVQGSVEAISAALRNLGTEEVEAQILHAGVGGINESDVTLAQASGGFILGFNVRANKQARDMAQQLGVDIRYYSIIYELIDDMRAAMSGLLAPAIRERQIGNAEIREVFNITRVGKVAGCRVIEGVVKRGAGVRLLRDNVVVHEGKLGTLKRFKDEVREVREGYECGMAFENYEGIQVGDIIECFEVEEVARTI